uniref:COX assembly mitochondrial protein n=1 Tax=Peronospora matthiolae TaxID=2874970 RepID=A0AAV1UGR1_9STRA
MTDASLPQCMSTVRFHEMLLDDTLGEREVLALETDRRLGGKYRALRSCDEAFHAMLDVDTPIGKPPTIHQEDATDSDARPQKKRPQLIYAEYMSCAGRALCEQSLLQWAACVQSVREQKKEIRECAMAKRMLERCLRGETEELLKISQPQVFRPSAAS